MILAKSLLENPRMKQQIVIKEQLKLTGIPNVKKQSVEKYKMIGAQSSLRKPIMKSQIVTKDQMNPMRMPDFVPKKTTMN